MVARPADERTAARGLRAAGGCGDPLPGPARTRSLADPGRFQRTKYRSTDLRIDLQGGRGVLTGRVSGDTLTFTGGHSFARPASKDVFTCNHGPFANNPNDPDDKKGLLARLAVGFNRSIMLTHPEQPNGATAADYYGSGVTNHWARVVHANSPIGYAFPYDDVRPDGEPDVSGATHDPNPRRFTVTVGS